MKYLIVISLYVLVTAAYVYIFKKHMHTLIARLIHDNSVGYFMLSRFP